MIRASIAAVVVWVGLVPASLAAVQSSWIDDCSSGVCTTGPLVPMEAGNSASANDVQRMAAVPAWGDPIVNDPLATGPSTSEISAAHPDESSPRHDHASTGALAALDIWSIKGIARIVGGLALVTAILLAVAWLVRSFSGGAARTDHGPIAVLHRHPLATGQQLQLLRVGHKLVLIAVSQGRVDSLAEISDPLEVEYLEGLCAVGDRSASAALPRLLTGRQQPREALRPDVAPRRPALAAASAYYEA
jgi:flagellar biogenesis protein FliO